MGQEWEGVYKIEFIQFGNILALFKKKMAINISDKKSLMENILPAVEISQTANGITVSSERIAVPRTIQFDILGKCRECKSTECEAEWCVTKEGVTIWCTRFKISPRFVPFDVIYDLPGHTFFKIRNKGRVFNVDHGFRSNACTQTPTPVYHLPPPPPPPQLPKRKHTDERESNERIVHQFYNSISAATTGIGAPQQEQQFPQHLSKKGEANEFFGAVSAATMGMDIDKDKPKQQQQQQTDPSSFFSSISAATMGMGAEHLKPKAKPRQRQQADATEFFSSISAATMGMGLDENKSMPKPMQQPNLNASEFAASVSAATTGLGFEPAVPKAKEAKHADATSIYSALSAATMGMNTEQPQHQIPKEKQQTDEEILDEFLESVSAATTNMDVSQKRKPKKKVKKEMEEEETAAIASISRKQ